jgi:hypothetical protein
VVVNDRGLREERGRGEKGLLCEVIRSRCNKLRWIPAQLWFSTLSMSNLDPNQIGNTPINRPPFLVNGYHSPTKLGTESRPPWDHLGISTRISIHSDISRRSYTSHIFHPTTPMTSRRCTPLPLHFQYTIAPLLHVLHLFQHPKYTITMTGFLAVSASTIYELKINLPPRHHQGNTNRA